MKANKLLGLYLGNLVYQLISSSIFTSGNLFPDSVLLLHQGSNFISLSILLLILEGVFFSSSLKRILAANITLKEKAGKIGTWQRT